MSSAEPLHDPPPRTPEGALLMECLELEGAERRCAVERLCRDHPSQAAALRHLYESLDGLGLADDPRPDEQPPERLGPYRLLQPLGSGGMGTVYLAVHEELDRKVALKVIHAAMAHAPRAQERFRREALAASRLDHSAICTVYDVGSADGVAYLAMQHVAGEPLDQLLARDEGAGGSMVDLPRSTEHAADGDLDAILRFVETLARALDAAHEAGLVHRDVKPGNVMVTPQGEPVLLDFGLVRLEEGDEPSLSLSGDRLGTPLYMAPEQVAGGGAPADRRADVYSLGVLLYQCLTLRPPFEAVNRQSLFQQILREEPPDPRKSNRTVGRDLYTVVQTAMAKEPARRYRTARAFAEDLHRVRSHEPIAARRAGPLLRLQRFAQRNPLAATFVVFLVAALVGAVLLLQERSVALGERGAALQGRSEALATAQAVGLARRAAEVGRDAPRLGLHLALRAVDKEHNLETVSELYAAVVRSHERVRLDHRAAVWGAEFSPDGERILTWSDDGTARLWDLEGNQLAEMRGPSMINWAQFSPDAERVVTTSQVGMATIWNLEGRMLHELDHTALGSRAMVIWAGFSPDGNRILTTSRDRKCHVWDSHTGQLLGEPFVRHSGAVGYGAWSPVDPDLVATAVDYMQERPDSGRFEVLLWHPGTGKVRAEIEGHEDSVHWLEFSPDGQALLTASSDETAWIWDLDGGELAPPLEVEGHIGFVAHARFSPDGERVVTASEDGGVRLWSRSGRLLGTARHDGPVFDARFVRGGTQILTASFDGTARLFDLQMRELLVLRGHSEWVWSANLSPDGRRVVTASWDNTARIWDVQDPVLPRLFHGGRVTALALRDDEVLVSASDDRTLRLTDLATLTSTSPSIEPRTLTLRLSPDGTKALVGHVDAVCRLYDLKGVQPVTELPHRSSPWGVGIFSGDGRIITGGSDGRVHAWKPDGEPLGEMEGSHKSRAIALDAAPRSGLLASSGWDGVIKIRNADGSVRGEGWHAHENWVNAVAFSPQEDRIASASKDRTVVIWSLAGDVIHRLLGHDGKVLAVAWSPDGDVLASGASDGTARLWRVSDGEPLAVLRGHTGAVNDVLFTRDGRLWTAGDDGAIQAWPVPRGATTWKDLADALVEHAQNRLAGELTDDEEERVQRLMRGK